MTATSGKTFEVTNPVNDKVIGAVQDSTPADAEAAIKNAADTFKQWSAVPGKERGNLLKNLLKLVNNHSEDLAKLMTAECGKPLAEAKAEVTYSAGIPNQYSLYTEGTYVDLSSITNQLGYLEWFSEEAKRIYGEVQAS